MRIDRLLLDRAGGSERRAVTQHRPQPQRVLDVIKEPNLQGQAPLLVRVSRSVLDVKL